MTRLANLPQSDFRADHYAEVELCERYDLFLAEELNESRNVVRVLYRWLAKYRRMVTFRNQTGPYGIPVGQIVANAGHIVNAAAANAGRSANTDEANADAGRSVNTDEANKGQIVSVNRDNGVGKQFKAPIKTFPNLINLFICFRFMYARLINRDIGSQPYTPRPGITKLDTSLIRTMYFLCITHHPIPKYFINHGIG